MQECLLGMLILINGLRSVRTDRCGPIDGGSERPRQGFDGFDELLTTCAAERAELTERAHGAIEAHRSGSRKEGEGEPMAMCMHAVKVGAWRNVCFLPLRGSRPESHRQDS